MAARSTPTQGASSASPPSNYLRGVTDAANSDEWDTEIGWPIFRTDD